MSTRPLAPPASDARPVTAASATFPCPRCGNPLDPAAADAVDALVTCSCGHRAYVGYVAEAVAMSARLGWLQDRIAAGDPAPPPDLARRYGVWGAPVNAARPGPERQPVGAQTLLLTLGSLLVIAGAIVFAAVMWAHLGVAGQVVLFAVLTLAVGGLAARLHPTLSRTSEALGVMAFGLLVVDEVAAPRLGFLPKGWFEPAHPYLAVAAALLAMAGLAAGHLTGVRAWVWLGWFSSAAFCGAVAWTVGDRAGGSRTAQALGVLVLTLAGVALLALSRGLGADRDPIRVAGAAALVVGIPIVAALALHADGLTGALVTTGITSGATGLAWRWRPDAWFRSLTLAGVGATIGLALLVPPDRQWVGLGAVAALAGAVVLVVFFRAQRQADGLLAAGVLWASWLVGRLARLGVVDDEAARDELADLVRHQVSWMALVVAATGFLVAWRRLGGGGAALLAWPAAAIGELGLVLAAPAWAPAVPESATLSFAALLLVAGVLNTRAGEPGSLARYGPALTMALLPSAVLTWSAPWVVDGASGPTGEHLVRMILVLAAGATLVIVGAWRRLAGVLEPAAAAVLLAGGAQLWTGLTALPRWIALAVAGTVLVLAGARLEWLRGEGHRASTWFHGLR